MWYIASNDSGCATLYLGIVTMLSSLSGFVTLYKVILAYDSGYIWLCCLVVLAVLSSGSGCVV